jgi:DNA-binding response OmpR family regulator
VETNKAFRRKMVSTLRNLGFATLEAGASDAALAKFQAHQMQIDLAIIELEIPSVSGLDLAAELERLRPGINVLYMSALHESIAMESIARRSPERVMLKPFDPSALAERARQLLTRVPPSDNGQARSASSRE